MTLLDTHIWVWWLQLHPSLPAAHRAYLEAHRFEGFGISVFSCWEVAKLASLGRLHLPLTIGDWMEAALTRPEVRLFPLSPLVAVEATHLPGDFHRDPADQIIVATARLHDVPLLTVDQKILDYAHVRLAKLPTAGNGAAHPPTP